MTVTVPAGPPAVVIGWVRPMIVNGSPSGSLPLASTAITVWLIASLSGRAIGGWFGSGITLIVTVALALAPRPSLIA